MTYEAGAMSDKITQAEMVEMFGDEMPIEAVNLLFDSPPDMTVGQIREALRRMAGTKTAEVSDKAYEQAVAWLEEILDRPLMLGFKINVRAVLAVLEREHEEAEKFRALEARAVTNGTLKVVINDTIMGLGAARKGVSDG